MKQEYQAIVVNKLKEKWGDQFESKLFTYGSIAFVIIALCAGGKLVYNWGARDANYERNKLQDKLNAYSNTNEELRQENHEQRATIASLRIIEERSEELENDRNYWRNEHGLIEEEVLKLQDKLKVLNSISKEYLKSKDEIKTLEERLKRYASLLKETERPKELVQKLLDLTAENGNLKSQINQINLVNTELKAELNSAKNLIKSHERSASIREGKIIKLENALSRNVAAERKEAAKTDSAQKKEMVKAQIAAVSSINRSMYRRTAVVNAVYALGTCSGEDFAALLGKRDIWGSGLTSSDRRYTISECAIRLDYPLSNTEYSKILFDLDDSDRRSAHQALVTAEKSGWPL